MWCFLIWAHIFDIFGWPWGFSWSSAFLPWWRRASLVAPLCLTLKMAAWSPRRTGALGKLAWWVSLGGVCRRITEQSVQWVMVTSPFACLGNAWQRQAHLRDGLNTTGSPKMDAESYSSFSLTIAILGHHQTHHGNDRGKTPRKLRVFCFNFSALAAPPFPGPTLAFWHFLVELHHHLSDSHRRRRDFQSILWNNVELTGPLEHIFCTLFHHVAAGVWTCGKLLGKCGKLWFVAQVRTGTLWCMMGWGQPAGAVLGVVDW